MGKYIGLNPNMDVIIKGTDLSLPQNAPMLFKELKNMELTVRCTNNDRANASSICWARIPDECH